MNEAISDKTVTIAENMKKVFAAGARSGGGGADWNANEGEVGYIKNRTHYKSDDFVPLGEDIVIETADGATGICYQTDSDSLDGLKEKYSTSTNPLLTVGEKYRVTINDEYVYECDGFVSKEGYNAPLWVGIGNATLAKGCSGGTDDPFFIVCPTGSKVWFYTQTAGNYKIKIEKFYENGVYVTLDPNYLPDSVRADKLEGRLSGLVTDIVGDIAGGLISVPTIELKIVEQDNSEKIYKVYGYTEKEYNAATKLPTLPVFDFEIEKADGKIAKYKLYGYEVGNGVE